MFQFSQQLKDRLAKYFKERKGITITSEQADEYLDSMADLYKCFIAMVKEK
jgi:hypothetical protein